MKQYLASKYSDFRLTKKWLILDLHQISCFHLTKKKATFRADLFFKMDTGTVFRRPDIEISRIVEYSTHPEFSIALKSF